MSKFELTPWHVFMDNEEFNHMPEDVRPRRLPFPYSHEDGTHDYAWVGGRIFQSNPDSKFCNSVGPEDKNPFLMVVAIEKGERAAGICRICHVPHFQRTHMGAEGNYVRENYVCFYCAFWELRMKKPSPVIIDGHMYSPGNRTHGQFRGMGGRRFDIEFIDGPHKGKRITTFDLWSGGHAPPYWAKQIKDNAIFLNHGHTDVIGETRYFQGSVAPLGQPLPDPYPLPSTLGLGN